MLETFGVRFVCVVPELGFIDCVKYQKVGEFLVGLRLRNVFDATWLEVESCMETLF